MKICVFGLGYVGTVTAGCLAEMGHEVIGIDVNPVKVDMINSGKSPVVEPGIDTVIAEQRRKNRIDAVTEVNELVHQSDILMICVGTPSKKEGALEVSYVKKVCKEIGQILTRSKTFPTVMVRSTLLPGKTENEVIPSLEKHSGLSAGKDFGICYNPEFLREGSAIHDFYHPPFLIFGEYDRQGAEAAAGLYEKVEADPYFVPIKTAEMVKYTCNSFHALKVAFANEIGNICKSEGIDSHSVMDIFCQDKELNLSSNYLKPGFAFGGSCLPKDLRSLLYHCRQQGLSLPVLEAILPSNESQIKIGIEMVKKTLKKTVGILGISFKPETDDLRNSPYVELAKELLDQGYQVQWYDENISPNILMGANKKYIEDKIPEFPSLRCESIENMLEKCEVIIFGGVNETYKNAAQKIQRDHRVIDLTRVISDPEGIKGGYQGICW